MQLNRVVKDISFDNSKLINGINKLADAVGSTLGPSGRTVVLEDDFGNPHITKDGVTVANGIVLDDAMENLGLNMARQAAQKTASKAGDGTTTSTVISQSIIEEYLKTGGDEFSFRDVRSGIDKFTNQVIKELDKRSVELDNDKLEHVAIISTNNDQALGGVIADAFNKAGENGVVTYESSQTSETRVDYVDGTHLGGTCKSIHFYTNTAREICELEKPLIFLCSSSIPNIRRIQGILEYAIKANKAILLIAPLEAQPLSALAMNKVQGNIKVNVIDPPSFGLKRKDILDDIALLTGAKVVDAELGDALDLISPDVLGSAEKAFTDSDGTTLSFSEKSDAIQKRIDELQEELDSNDHHVLVGHLKKRIGLLSGGVSVIRIGADTEVELKEKTDRVDDAVQAVRAARKEGILPGGGSTLACIGSNSKFTGTPGELAGWNILSEALKSPFKKIMDNAGLDIGDFKYTKKGQGVDVTKAKVVDMVKAGIVDPTLVTKEALRNAVSVATTILSTDAVITNQRAE